MSGVVQDPPLTIIMNLRPTIPISTRKKHARAARPSVLLSLGGWEVGQVVLLLVHILGQVKES